MADSSTSNFRSASDYRAGILVIDCHITTTPPVCPISEQN
jgi:hypothetical protein